MLALREKIRAPGKKTSIYGFAMFATIVALMEE